ncbi:MAG: hypothetical protein GY795_48480 [Desulfobacterales bacterium]|nr:hypothetical protein [Desulfobacterales bacterium]
MTSSRIKGKAVVLCEGDIDSVIKMIKHELSALRIKLPPDRDETVQENMKKEIYSAG